MSDPIREIQRELYKEVAQEPILAEIIITHTENGYIVDVHASTFGGMERASARREVTQRKRVTKD